MNWGLITKNYCNPMTNQKSLELYTKKLTMILKSKFMNSSKHWTKQIRNYSPNHKLILTISKVTKVGVWDNLKKIIWKTVLLRVGKRLLCYSVNSKEVLLHLITLKVLHQSTTLHFLLIINLNLDTIPLKISSLLTLIIIMTVDLSTEQVLMDHRIVLSIERHIK